MSNAVVHFELNSKQPERLSAFYEGAFVGAGGKLLLQEQEDPGMGRFTLFEDPDGRTMGLWKSKGAA